MDLPTFVASKFNAIPCDPKRPSIASGLLALDADRVSVLIEQWRGIGSKVLPLTYAEFCAVLTGDVSPSESIRRVWQRLPLNRYRPNSPAIKTHLAERSDDLLATLSGKYEVEAQRILKRFAGKSPSPRLYASYLAGAGRDARRAFFRSWAMPFPEAESAAHSYIAAGSGFGKSELIKALVFERVRRGEGIVVLDPHGSMAEQIARWPEVARCGRLVYIDPYIAGPEGNVTPVINPLDPLKFNPYKEAAVSYLIECLQRVVGEMELTQRMEALLKTVLPALAHKEQPTLEDLVNVMAPQPAKQKQAQEGEDPTHGMLAFVKAHSMDNAASCDFMAHDFLSPGYNNSREAIRGRLQYLLSSLTFQRCIMGSPARRSSTINLRQEIDRGAIIVINLASQKLGGGVSADLGKFLLASLFSAAMSRQDVPESQRKTCFAYLDEADSYLNESVSDIYAQARKFGLFLAVVQQVPGADMTPKIQSQVFGNSGIRIAGNSGDPASITLLANITRASEEAVQDLRRGEFLFYTASNLHRAWIRRDLLGDRYSISNEEWERVKADQIHRYYRNHRSARPAADPMQPGIDGVSTATTDMQDARNPDL